MKDQKNPPPDFTELRWRAEQRLQVQTVDPETLSPEECIRLVHELQVHQIELEMQNEELRQTQARLAESKEKYADLYDFAPLGYLTLNERGQITAANLTAATLLGLERGSLINRFFSHFLGESDRLGFLQLLHNLPDLRQQRGEFRLQDGNGDGRFMLLNILCIREAQGREQYRVSLTDITELKQTQEELRHHKEELEELVTARTAQLRQGNAQLREANENLEALFQASPLAIGVFDAQGRMLKTNPVSERIFGWTPAEIEGRFLPSVPREAPEEALAVLHRALQGETFVGMEVTHQRRDGARIDVSLSAAPLHDQAGKVRGFVGLAEDISERKQAERALQTQAQVLANMAEGVVVTDGQGNIVYTNPAFDQMFGYEPGELLGQLTNILNAYPPDENLCFIKEIIQQIKTTGVWQGEYHNRKKDGSTFYTAARISALQIDGKKLYISVQDDITSRKITEREMARLASFPQLNPNPVLEIDGSGTVNYCNPAGLQTLARLGVPDEPWRFLPSDWKDLRRSFQESGELQFYQEVTINGGVFAETISYVPEPEAIRIYAWNITLRRQAEEALKQSEERYRSLFQNNHAVMLLIDPETGDIVDVNPAASRYYGFSHEDLTAKKIYEINKLTKDQIFAVMAQAKTEEQRQFYFRHCLASGEVRDVEVFSGPVVIGAKKLLYSIVHDITERTRLEAEVAMKAQLLDLSSDSIFVVDSEGNFQYVNESASKTRGYSREELLNTHLADLDTPEQADLIPARTRMIQEKGEASFESAHRRQDGSVMPVEVYVKQIQIDGRVLLLSSVRDITERRQSDEALRQERDFSAALLNILGALVIVLDRDGRIVRFNQACETITGYTFAEVEGKLFFDIFLVPEEKEAVQEVFQHLKQGDVPKTHENHWFSRSGDKHLISWSNTILTDAEGEVLYIIGTGIAITEQRRAEEALRRAHAELELRVAARTQQLRHTVDKLLQEIADRERAEARLKESEARFAAFMKHLPGSAIMRDREGRFLFVNESWEKILGRRPGESLGKTVDDYWPPEVAHRLKEFDRQVLSQNRPLESEVELLVGGKMRTFLTYRFPIRGETGQVEMVGAIGIDITDRLKAEEVRDRLIEILEATPDFVGSADRGGQLFYLNRAAREMLGLSATVDITGMTFSDTQFPWAIDRNLSEGQATYAREGVWQGETAILCRDGMEIPVSQVILVHRALDGKVKFFSTICRDISAMKQAEENLRKSEEKLRLLTTQLLTAQEDERKRLAAELHDELGHALLTLKLHMSSVERRLLPEQADLKEKMHDMVGYLTDTVEEVRRLYRDLSPGDLEDLGLTTALRTMVEDFQELYAGIDWKVDMADIDDLFPLHIQTMIYRIVQEALTNIGKHAYPEHVTVKVTKKDQQAVFVIADDGCGFSMDDLPDGDQKGMGLAAMAQRVSLVGGIFDLWSRENQGARITFSIPGTEKKV